MQVTISPEYQPIIDKLKAKRGFKAAYQRLINSQDISTGDLKYFNISFDSFLRYAQWPENNQKAFISYLIKSFA